MNHQQVKNQSYFISRTKLKRSILLLIPIGYVRFGKKCKKKKEMEKAREMRRNRK